jgi:hypothetical protein
MGKLSSTPIFDETIKRLMSKSEHELLSGKDGYKLPAMMQNTDKEDYVLKERYLILRLNQVRASIAKNIKKGVFFEQELQRVQKQNRTFKELKNAIRKVKQ